MEIIFWGATETVTGSMTFFKLPEGLICVDAGLYQGTPEIEKLNETPLPFKPRDIKSVVLTHAHLDHSGFLPYLVKNGFRGPIFCTKATLALVKIILEDSAKIMEKKYYDPKDVQRTLNLVKIIKWNEVVPLLGGSIKLIPAGHILGASSVEIISNNKKIIVSGDLGRSDDPLMDAPNPIQECDAVIMESTYGSRKRTGVINQEIESFINRVKKQSAVGIIASFAVARAQLIIHAIDEYFLLHPENRIKVFLDSPMMLNANKIYKKFSFLTKNPETLKKYLESCHFIEYQNQWDHLKKKTGPMIIISSSGMLSGGRILRYLENWQHDKTAILFLAGHQSEGSPGQALLKGQRDIAISEESLIHWCGEVLNSDAFSSHADQDELLEWTKKLDKKTPIYLIHGDHESKIKLRTELKQHFEMVYIPKRMDTFKPDVC
jgi:metallo-beta-lactamase family protein